jgi:hypothetical protein
MAVRKEYDGEVGTSYGCSDSDGKVDNASWIWQDQRTDGNDWGWWGCWELHGFPYQSVIFWNSRRSCFGSHDDGDDNVDRLLQSCMLVFRRLVKLSRVLRAERQVIEVSSDIFEVNSAKYIQKMILRSSDFHLSINKDGG